MRIGMLLSYSDGFQDCVRRLGDFEKAGLDIVFVPEAYSFDAVSQLGFIAARTERLEIASGILQLYTRTPSLVAMTAAGLDYVSDGRFTLGIGASGPQVIEGFHGVPYDAPLTRTRELVDICRMVWRRDPVVYEGAKYTVPLPADRGTGLGKPLKLINHPVRKRIPVVLAAIGPKNVALAAEIAEGWKPVFFHPEKAAEVWGPALAEGTAQRDPALGPLDIVAEAPLAIGDDTADLLDLARPRLALYIGGMGAPGKNFYNNLCRRYGFEKEAAEIQDLYLSGRKREAEAAVPLELLRATSLVGPESLVAERLAAYRAAGVTTLNIQPVSPDTNRQLADVARLRALTGDSGGSGRRP
ncbi:LLM class F420-dependent oxidoreductase [Streptomyces sp. Y7]|uniref:LLM class F420-dependent oxidoreductase n=1 Tax=Streptomyces sp. Y7 TaxID=3342392 RepID=UPI003712D079